MFMLGPAVVRSLRWPMVLAGTLLLIVLRWPEASACTRVLWTGEDKVVVVGRNMDWDAPMPSDFYALPRGVARNGMSGENTLKWTAKYGSLVVVPPGAAASDGINEKRLAGHLLWLSESDYGEFDPARPSLGIGLWLQYYLDNFATVREAVEFTRSTPFQIVSGEFEGSRVMLHLALEDETGDSAIIEYVAGKPQIHHGPQFTVLTNSPPYPEQLRRLQEYAGFGGDRSLPGTNEAADRFVRAAYYLQLLPQPNDERERVAAILSVMRNVAQPFGTSDPTRPNIAPTRFRTVIDITNGVYFYESTTSPSIVWVQLSELNFAPEAGVRKLDLIQNPDRVGDNSNNFEPAPEPQLPPLDLD